jgi:RNA polymerase sigma factor (TIGR02999 family)
MPSVIHILEAAERGDPRAAEELLPLVYDELRRIAVRQMAQEKPGQTLDATALVHEAYLRLTNSPTADGWQSRSHFVAAAAESMRRILVDRARAKATVKRGGNLVRVELDEFHRIADSPDALLALDDALNRFAVVQPQKAQLVQLRFFGGLTMPQAAATLNVSLTTAERWWVYAKSWLYAVLADGDDENSKK